jgi:hypothetical protein
MGKKKEKREGRWGSGEVFLKSEASSNWQNPQQNTTGCVGLVYWWMLGPSSQPKGVVSTFKLFKFFRCINTILY